MGVVGTIIQAGVALIGGGATVYSSIKAEEARGEAKTAMAKQGEEQTKYINDAKAKQAETEKQQAAVQDRQAGSQQRRQQRAQSGATRSTILTSPLGLTTEPVGGRKTLLGS